MLKVVTKYIKKSIDIFWTILTTYCTKNRCLCCLVKNQPEVELFPILSSRKALKDVKYKLLILKFIINKVNCHYVKEILATCSPDVYKVSYLYS